MTLTRPLKKEAWGLDVCAIPEFVEALSSGMVPGVSKVLVAFIFKGYQSITASFFTALVIAQH
jgi:hypothetical protein